MEFDGEIEGSWVVCQRQVAETIEKCSVTCDCLAMLDQYKFCY